MGHEHSTDEPERRRLLAMLAVCPDASAEAAPLSGEQWAQLARMACQHRLEPLLHAARRQDAGSQPPDDLLADWQAAWRESGMRALALQATLHRLDRLLTRAGIAYAALKGARLAWHAYPHPAMRPMRDLDILVAPETLREAWHSLIGNGFTPETTVTLPAEGLLTLHKHLPALCDRKSGVCVEVHSRLFEDGDAAQATGTMSDSAKLLAGRVQVNLGNSPISYLPSTEALLHLIVHSAYEHHFENGPQVLHDIAAHLAAEPVDWFRFWHLAREGGWERGCQLVLELTEQLMGPQQVDWRGARMAAIPAEVRDQAALLMLQDPDLRQDLAVQLQLSTPAGATRGSVRALLSRLRARKEAIADHAGVPADARFVWLHYPAWLLSRARRTFAGAVDPRQQQEVVRARAVGQWLGSR